ncbi:MAG: PAS domain-containing protein [candidate division Zixibacteria bacterium]|nr:PAS domain-containing protein [candidate division Zixibacteria bacterium]
MSNHQRSGIKLRRALPLAIGGLVILVVAGIVISRIVNQHDLDQQKGRQAHDALVVSQVTEARAALGDTAGWTQAASVWSRILGERVQFFDSSGSSLADSDSLGEAGAEFSAIIRQALTTGQASVLAEDKLHSARRFEQNGQIGGVVVLSTHRRGTLDAIRWPLFWVTAVAILLVAAISVLSLISSTRALNRLAEGAARFSEGDWDARVPVDPYRRADVFTAVAHAFNRMAGEVKFRFDQQRQQREQLEAVVRNMNDGLLAVDAAGVVRLVNQTFLRYFRSAFEDPVGHTHAEAFRDQGLNQMIEKTLSGVPEEEGELEVLAPSRRVLVVRMALIPDVRQNDVRAVLLARDVTARRRLQELRRDFVANVSHELRTPLTAVLGYVEALRDTASLSQEASGFLDTISRNAQRMERIVGDLLELSRIESPGYSLQLSECSLDSLAQEVAENFHGPLTDKNQKLSVAIPPTLGTIVADRDGIARILSNLVDNAHKYTPPGGKITIEAERAGDDIVLSVSDDGIGVPEEKRSRLFERFYRVDRDRSRDSGGTGLGLAIVKHLAEAHGGSAVYEARVPAGSRLIVRLPQGHEARDIPLSSTA